MEALRREYFERGKDSWVGRIGRRMKTIADERTLNFLSRKAVIPKYGFPVDVVELDVRSSDGRPTGVALQRDLSQAIAEYAPGGKVVANKLEWESCGVKTVAGKAWPVRHYRYDDARNFRQWNEGDAEGPPGERKYLIPAFGFVTPLFKKPSEPQGRAHRLYTTRPFFRGFDAQPESKTVSGVQVTRPFPEYWSSCARAETGRASTSAVPVAATWRRRRPATNRRRTRIAWAPWSASPSATNWPPMSCVFSFRWSMVSGMRIRSPTRSCWRG